MAERAYGVGAVIGYKVDLSFFLNKQKVILVYLVLYENMRTMNASPSVWIYPPLEMKMTKRKRVKKKCFGKLGITRRN